MENKDLYCYCIEPDFKEEDIISKCHKCGGIKPINSKELILKPKVKMIKIKKEIKQIKTTQKNLL